MSEMRYNPITLDWVIMASARAMKPNDYSRPKTPRPAKPERREGCPFCVGSESLTAQEIHRVDDSAGEWLIRVVANKFPAFVPAEELQRRTRGTFRCMTAAGSHEVVIDSPRHNASPASMPVGELRRLLGVYRDRYRSLAENPHVQSIVIFKNHGERAGTSLEHPHSQIIAAPVVSCQVEARLQEARRYHSETGDCLYCRVLADELEAGERIVQATDHFVAFVPYAALSPYHLWIFPKVHTPSFGSAGGEMLDSLAEILSRQLRALSLGLDDPDYNLLVRSAPAGAVHSPYYHWYIAIVPRVSHLAGYELGSGTYINSLRPEDCAETLRAAMAAG